MEEKKNTLKRDMCFYSLHLHMFESNLCMCLYKSHVQYSNNNNLINPDTHTAHIKLPKQHINVNNNNNI